jgi:phospholipid transport system substrate-binding protein
MRRSPERKRGIAGIAAIALLVTVSAGAAMSPNSEQDARKFVQSTIDDVMSVLRNPNLPLEQKKDRVQNIAYERFDFPLISKLVLARNWRRFSEKQRTEFIEAFKKHLAATYRDTLDNYRDEKISITGAREESNGDVTVMTEISTSGSPTHVNYRLRKTDEGWRGIDVIIEGVSLVQNFRSQAQEIVSNEGPDALIQKLRNKQISSPHAKKT